MNYEMTDAGTFLIEDDGSRRQLSNFQAQILEETHFVDGRTTECIFLIAGKRVVEENTIDLPKTSVPAPAFATLGWVMPAWGAHAIIYPGTQVKEHLRAAIQSLSNPKTETIYRHTGWTTIAGKRCYLHNAGAISAKGNNPNTKIELPAELSRYSLKVPHSQDELKQAVLASLSLIDLGPPRVTWPLLAATFCPLLCEPDFALHITGRTGTYKSEVTSLFQSHYGEGMDARHLPGSWSSTANALEAQAFYTKNALFAIDDFVPSGTSWQQKVYQTTADKIIRAQGNQSGRARLTDTSSLQQTMYPRGLILSTGEDTPQGHSIRARMMILELAPGDIDTKQLTHAQQRRSLYPLTTGAFAQALAKNPTPIKELAEEVRDENITIGHSRTPSMLGTLTATALAFLEWATNEKVIPDYGPLFRAAYEAMKQSASAQTYFLETSDPCEMFAAALRNILALQNGHLRSLEGGVPARAPELGWSVDQNNGDLPVYKSHGPCIGWTQWKHNTILIDAEVGLHLIYKVLGSDMALTKQTLLKRLKEGGIINKSDPARQRNTIRVKADNIPKNAISIDAKTIFNDLEDEGDLFDEK